MRLRLSSDEVRLLDDLKGALQEKSPNGIEVTRAEAMRFALDYSCLNAID